MPVQPRLIRSITNHLNEEQTILEWGTKRAPAQHATYTHSKYPAKQHFALTRWANVVRDAAKGIYPQSDDKGDVVWNAPFGKTAS